MATLSLSLCLLFLATVEPASASCSKQLEEKLETYNCTCDVDNEIGSYAKCIGTKLTSVPADLPTDSPLHGIHMEGHNFNCLQSIPYPAIQRVILSSNNIKCFSSAVFATLAEVDTLVLVNNSFLLDPETFRGMKSLKRLDLDSNPLYELVNLTFSGDATPHLDHLNLANCRIYQTDPLAFDNLHELRVLNMSRNRLSSPPTLVNASTLHTLDLSFNRLADLEGLPQSGIHKVETLHLDHNMLTALSATDFHGLVELKHLTVSFNQLAEVNPSTFDSLINLNSLRLDHNELKSLKLNDDHQKTLQSLQVHHNRWLCDCEISWMRDHLKVKQFNPPEQMLCSSPADVNGQSLFEVDIHKFDCPGKFHGLHNNTVALALGIIVSILGVVVISFLVFQFVVKRKRSKGNVSYQEVDWNNSEDRLQDRLAQHL